MKKILTFFPLLLVMLPATAQVFDYNTSDHWSAKPELHPIHHMFDSSSAVGILDDRTIAYKKEGDAIYVYATYHKIIRVQNDRGIEMFNKVYIPLEDNATVSDIKARTILPGGRILDLDTSQVKQTDESGDSYKIFAMEGVEKGAEVEYSYTEKKQLSLFGSELFQSAFMPYQEEKFALITPANLRFSVKGYNGFTVSPDSLIGDQRIIVGYAKDVSQLEEEKYSYRDQYLKRVDYKLSYNLSQEPDVRLYTWQQFAKRAYDYYTGRTAKEDKALDEFVSRIPIPATDEVARILSVEDYIKTTINIDKKLIAQGADDIVKIIGNRSADNDGATRLFAGVFDKLNIDYQLVFAGDRSGFPFDPELENWNRASEMLFYFPQTGKYLSPDAVEYRYPYFPYNLGGTDGLYLKGTIIGNYKAAIGSFASVDLEPYDSSAINMQADLQFNATLDTLLIKSTQLLKGYGASEYRPIYLFLPRDKQEEANQEIIKSVPGTTAITNIQVENTSLDNYATNKPLIISADSKNAELLETAGSTILLKIGEIIGTQEEMYQEKPRVLPVEMPFPHVEDRDITVHIPEGYSIKNLNDLTSDISFRDPSNNLTMGFISTYTLTGSILHIQIRETYRNLRYPLDQFNNFRKVINASADFNKVVLVLEKKS